VLLCYKEQQKSCGQNILCIYKTTNFNLFKKRSFITAFQFASEEDLALTFAKCFVQFFTPKRYNFDQNAICNH